MNFFQVLFQVLFQFESLVACGAFERPIGIMTLHMLLTIARVTEFHTTNTTIEWQFIRMDEHVFLKRRGIRKVLHANITPIPILATVTRVTC